LSNLPRVWIIPSLSRKKISDLLASILSKNSEIK
jgi:hypothetical protein